MQKTETRLSLGVMEKKLAQILGDDSNDAFPIQGPVMNLQTRELACIAKRVQKGEFIKNSSGLPTEHIFVLFLLAFITHFTSCFVSALVRD